MGPGRRYFEIRVETVNISLETVETVGDQVETIEDLDGDNWGSGWRQ